MPRINESVLLAAAAAVLIGCLSAGSADAAAPPVDTARTRCAAPRPADGEDEGPPAVVATVMRQAVYVLLTTSLVSPFRNRKRHPPPDKPQPLVVKPPPPSVPDDNTPIDPPPQLQEAPEPASLVTGLVGGTLGAMAWWRHRRRRQPVPQPEESQE